MKYAKHLFYELINQRTVTAGIYAYLQNNNIPLDSSDLLRWQWVLAVSALDKYVHDIVLKGMLDEFLGKRPLTKSYKNFTLDMNAYITIVSAKDPGVEFEKEIVHKHGYLAFQYPDKISNALSYIWEEQHKWRVISSNMGTPISEDNLKIKLTNIIVRRNQIVHEGDCLTAQIPLSQQVITKEDTENVVSFITELVEAIDKSIV